MEEYYPQREEKGQEKKQAGPEALDL